MQMAVLLLEQNIGQHWQRVSPPDNAGNCLQRLQQRIALVRLIDIDSSAVTRASFA